MKIGITAIMVWLMSIPDISAQNILKGTVIDIATSEPLPGAMVYISDLRTGAATNSDGYYSLSSLPSGSFLVEVRFVGYKTLIISQRISGETEANFVLEPAVTELNEIIVTGVARSTELSQSPIAVKSVSKDFLDQRTSTNIIDALAAIPGINQITTGSAISKPVIRGLGYNRIITLNNGIRQEGQQWGDEHGIEVDEYSVSRAEIVKGPGSLMYGSDGIAGVLNLIASNPLPEGELRGSVSSNYQTNGNLIGWSAFNSGTRNGIQWTARISQKLAGNYSNTYDGKVFNSGFNELNGNAMLGVSRSWGYSQLNVSSFNQQVGMVEGERNNEGRFLKLTADPVGQVTETVVTDQELSGYSLSIPKQAINHFRVSSNNYLVLGSSSLALDLAFQKSKRKEFGNPADEDQAELFFDLNTLNYNLRYHFPEWNGWEHVLGANGMYQVNTNKGEEAIVPDYSLLDFGAFFTSQKMFREKLVTSWGLRYDVRSIDTQELLIDNSGVIETKFSGFKENYSNFSGSLGLSYSLSKSSTIKVNVSRGFRAPNIAETGSNGAHEGTFRHEYGVSSLEPEISHQFDLGLSYNSDHVSIEVSPFVNLIDNYIFTEKLLSVSGADSIPNPADPIPAFTYTQGNASLYGGEAIVDIHPHPIDWLHIENGFSYVRAIQANQPDSTKNLPFIPAPHYRGELRATILNKGKRFANLSAGIRLDYYFGQNNFFEAFGTETATAAYSLLGADISFSIINSTGVSLFTVRLSGDNLADIAYQSHLSRLKYAPENPATGRSGVWNMGRNFSVKVFVPLNFVARKKQ